MTASGTDSRGTAADLGDENMGKTGNSLSPDKTQSWILPAIAFCILMVVHLFLLVRSESLYLPPLPGGDGPDYENIAFQVVARQEFGFDWGSKDWRRPYLDVSAAQLMKVDSSLSLDDSTSPYAIQFDRQPGLVPTTARPPLYPWMIAVLYKILTRGPTAFAAIRIFQAVAFSIAGAISVAMTQRVLRRYFGASNWCVVLGSLITLVMAIIDRTTKSYLYDFLTEPLALMLTQFFLYALLCMVTSTKKFESPDVQWQKRDMLALFFLGVMLALLVLTRSIFVFFMPFVFALIVWLDVSRVECDGSKKALAGRWKYGAVVIMVATFVLAPWWIRNCWVLGKWMPLGTQGPISMLGGYSDEALKNHGEWNQAPEIAMRAEIEKDAKYLAEKNRVRRELMVVEEAKKRTWEWIGNHWKDLPRLGVERAISLWGPYSGRSLVWKLSFLLGAIWLVIFAPRSAVVYLAFPLMTTVLVMLLYSTGARFLVPCYGVLYSLSGIGIGGGVAWMREVVKRRVNSDPNLKC